MNLYMFRTVSLSIIRSFSLYTQQWYMSYRFADNLRVGANAPAHKPSANLYDIYHCCVYSEKLLMMDRETIRKNVEFHFKNKLEKLVHLVGFIVRNIWRCTVTWTANKIGCLHTRCPTRYRTRHFFNNFTTNEDIATKFEADWPHCLRNATS